MTTIEHARTIAPPAWRTQQGGGQRRSDRHGRRARVRPTRQRLRPMRRAGPRRRCHAHQEMDHRRHRAGDPGPHGQQHRRRRPGRPGRAATGGVPAAPTGYAELDQAMGADQPFTGTRSRCRPSGSVARATTSPPRFADFEAATGIDVTVAEVPSGQHETARQRVAQRRRGGRHHPAGTAGGHQAVRRRRPARGHRHHHGHREARGRACRHPGAVHRRRVNIWAIPYKVDVKSVVWYPIKAFEDRGYAVPTTWDELIAAVRPDRRRRQGSPWCIGIDAGSATGWIITDWIEDIMLRTAGVEAYNKWITHELPFISPEVKNAFDLVGKIFFTPDYVLGGNTAILATSQIDAMDPMFTDDMANPGCWMQKQADLVRPRLLPGCQGRRRHVSKYVIGEDIGLFYFPPIDPAMGTPALGAGDALMVTADRPEVRAVAAVPLDAGRHRGLGQGWQRHLGQPDHPGRVVRRQLQAGDRLGHRGQRHFLRLRCVRPDAGRGRRRVVLDRHGRLDRRQRLRTPMRCSRPSTPAGRPSSPVALTVARCTDGAPRELQPLGWWSDPRRERVREPTPELDERTGWRGFLMPIGVILGLAGLVIGIWFLLDDQLSANVAALLYDLSAIRPAAMPCVPAAATALPPSWSLRPSRWPSAWAASGSSTPGSTPSSCVSRHAGAAGCCPGSSSAPRCCC